MIILLDSWRARKNAAAPFDWCDKRARSSEEKSGCPIDEIQVLSAPTSTTSTLDSQDCLTVAWCRQILKEIIEKKEGMGDMMKTSFFSMTEAIYSSGESVKHTIHDNVETATVRVNGGLDNVAGVKIPKFQAEVIPGESKMDLTGVILEPWALQRLCMDPCSLCRPGPRRATAAAM